MKAVQLMTRDAQACSVVDPLEQATQITRKFPDSGFLVIAGFIMLGRFAMMMRGALVVIGGGLVMLAALVRLHAHIAVPLAWCADGEEIAIEV